MSSLPVASGTASPLRESARNRLLRRADWRFLAGTPEGGTSVCFTGDALARAVAAVSRVVDPATAAAIGGCDTVVAVDPDLATLRAAWAALRPGGTCYTEWRRLRSGGPYGIRRRLARMGWVGVTCYAPRPDPAAAGAWVPLDSTAATRYFLQQRGGPAPLRRRVTRALRRALWLSGYPARINRPICVVARKPADQHAPVTRLSAAGHQTASYPDFAAELIAQVREGWESWGLGPAPRRPSLLLQTGGPRSVSKVIALVFAESRREPALVIKIPRVPESLGPLHREAEALRVLAGRAGIPRLLFARTHASVYTVGESVVRGTPLVSLGGTPRFAELAFMATAWIGALGEGAVSTAQQEWHGRLVERALADFVDAFGAVLDHGMVREAEARLKDLGPLPLVCEHRDFSPWNVLLTPRGDLGVLDWESAELQGLPALDLIYFLTYWGFFLDGAVDAGHRRASYRAALDPGTFVGSTSRECLGRYAAQLRIPAAALGALRLLVWLIHARSEYQRFRQDVGGTPGEAVLCRSLFLALWGEELRHGMSR